MAKKKNKNTNRNLLILIGVIVFIFLVIIFLNQKQTNTYEKTSPIILPTATPTPSITQYHSKILKISLSAPSSFMISESDNYIAFKNIIGKISVSRQFTNNDTIEGVVFGISDRGTSQVTNKKKFKINGLDVISCDIKSLVNNDPDSKGYYFYPAPWTVFSISTDVPELFGDLDQIAQSFRYEP